MSKARVNARPLRDIRGCAARGGVVATTAIPSVSITLAASATRTPSLTVEEMS
jgi:hypothetical protein